MSTRQIVIKNISANLLLQIVTIIGGFILPPLIVTTYGSAVNGMVASIKQFINYLTLLEAGVGAAGLVALYPALAKQDHPLRNRILASIHHFYRISGSLFAVGLVILAVVYGWITRHQISPELTFWMVIVLGSVNVMDFFFCGMYRILMTADRKNYVVSTIQMFGVIVNVAVSYGLIRFGYSILTVQLISSAILISKFAVFGYYAKRSYDQLEWSYDRHNAFKIEQTWDVLIHQFCGLVVFSSPLVLITIFLSLKDASIYAVYLLVFAGVRQVLQSLSQGMQAVFGHSFNQNQPHTVQHFNLYESMFICMIGWAYSCTAVLFFPFITLYTANMHDANYYQPFLAWLFLLVGVVENIRIPSLTMIMAAGHYKNTKYQALLEALINLTFSVVFIYFFGLNGLLVGALLSFLYRSNEMIFYTAKHILAVSVRMSYIKLFVVGVLAAVCIWLGNLIIHAEYVDSYFDWLKLAATTSTVCAVPFGITFLIIKRWRY